MNVPYGRPLPAPPYDRYEAGPGMPFLVHNAYNNAPRSSADIYATPMQFAPGMPLPHHPATQASPANPMNEGGSSFFSGGAMLHKGFYDLLALIPTATASRLLWGPPREEPAVVAGPRYENIAPRSPPAATATPALPNANTNLSPKKGRRLSKDMVSKPMNFV